MKMVSVVSPKGVRITQKFQDPEMAQSFVTKATRKFPKHLVYIFDTNEVVAPPEDYMPTRSGTLWCPFCGTERRFVNGGDGYRRCSVCKISDNEYSVRKFNHLWNETSTKRRRRKRKNA